MTKVIICKYLKMYNNNFQDFILNKISRLKSEYYVTQTDFST